MVFLDDFCLFGYPCIWISEMGFSEAFPFGVGELIVV